jgi:hypothetical protein
MTAGDWIQTAVVVATLGMIFFTARLASAAGNQTAQLARQASISDQHHQERLRPIVFPWFDADDIAPGKKIFVGTLRNVGLGPATGIYAVFTQYDGDPSPQVQGMLPITASSENKFTLEFTLGNWQAQRTSPTWILRITYKDAFRNEGSAVIDPRKPGGRYLPPTPRARF